MRPRKTRAHLLALTDAKVILRDIGLLIQVPGLMALLSLPVALFFQEYEAIWPLLLTALASFSLGQGAYRAFRRAGEATLAHGMVIASLGWLLVPFFGTIPLYLIALRLVQAQGPGAAQTLIHFTSPLNALFEAVSGYTGTGLTMTLDPQELPRTLQWWRSFMEWIGGVGVIVLMLAIITSPRPLSLYYAEARQERIHPSIRSTVRTIWWIFLIYTVGSALLLWLAGMPPWDAINHAMSALDTGGFSVRKESIAFYDSLWIELALFPVMIFGALSFAVHYRLLRQRRLFAFWEDLQSRWFLILLGGGILLLALENLSYQPPLSDLRRAAFQFTSALSTCGLQTAKLKEWSKTGKLILTLAMVFGAAAGSTGGGIKTIRTVILACGVRWRLRKLIAPPDVLVRFRLGRQFLSDGEASDRLIEAGTLLLLWGFFLLLGIVVLLRVVPAGYGLEDVILEVVSAQSNVGLSTGLTGPHLPAAAKLMLCFNMWIGRLEIIPVLLLLRATARGLE